MADDHRTLLPCWVCGESPTTVIGDRRPSCPDHLHTRQDAGEHPVLCYVDEPWAWFTTCPLDQQYGDDWNDAPYHCNAGEPYEWSPDMANRGIAEYRLMKVAFDGPWETARGIALNSPWSVQDINRGSAPWLVTDRYSAKALVTIKAGTDLMEFVRLVHDGGGHVYTLAR